MRRIHTIIPITLLGIVSLILVACHHDDPVDKPSKSETPISLSNTELDPQAATRAVGLEENGVESFYVWSYKTKTKSGDNYTGLETVMEQYMVQWTQNTAGTTTSNGYDWEYVGLTNGKGETQNIKYWDMEATSYRFFGIAPCSATGITYDYNHTNPKQATEYDITFAANASDVEHAPYISRLWITNNQTDFPSRHYKDVVTMEFMKPVTKVRIELVTEDGKPVTDPAVQGITSLLFAPTSGTKIIYNGQLKVSYPLQGPITFTQYLPKLEVQGDEAGSLMMNRIKAVDPNAADDYADWYFVLPHIKQEAFQLSLTINGKSRMATVPAELMSWNPNMEYTYKFKLTASDVQFIDIVQIGVTEWRTQDVEHSIYNW